MQPPKSLTPALLLERLQKALDHGMGTHSIEDVVRGIERGEFQCFHNDQAMVVTSIHDTPRRRYMHVFLSCGDLDSVAALQPQLDECCRKHGCEYQTSASRRGFVKKGMPAGWEPRHVVFVREVPHVQG